MQLNMGMVKEACRVLLVMGEPTTYDNIARFIGIDKMVLLKFLEKNMGLIELFKRKIGRTTKVCVSNVYLSLTEKPWTKEWIEVQRQINANRIKLKTIDNYGAFIAYSLEVDTTNDQIYNTKDKVEYIAKTLNLETPGWHYYIGGLGDCCLVEAKGYKVEASHINLIEQLGFECLK